MIYQIFHTFSGFHPQRIATVNNSTCARIAHCNAQGCVQEENVLSIRRICNSNRNIFIEIYYFYFLNIFRSWECFDNKERVLWQERAFKEQCSSCQCFFL